MLWMNLVSSEAWMGCSIQYGVSTLMSITSKLLCEASLFMWPFVLHPPLHGFSLWQDRQTLYIQTVFQDHRGRSGQVFCHSLDSITSPTFYWLKGRHSTILCHPGRGLNKGFHRVHSGPSLETAANLMWLSVAEPEFKQCVSSFCFPFLNWTEPKFFLSPK